MALTYGVTIGLNFGPGQSGANYQHWGLLIPDMKNIGLTRLRFQLSWNSIELNQGSYTWGPLDDAVQQCNTNGIKIVFPIRGAPTWALLNASQQATDEPFYLPDPTYTAGFCQALVNRYGPGSSIGVIDGYEIMNEDMNIHFTNPNGGFHAIHNTRYSGLYGSAGQADTASVKVNPGRAPEYWEPIAAACYPVLKQTGKPVGMCAMWWVQNAASIPNTSVSNYYAFLDSLFADGTLPNYADYVNFHYYSNSTLPTANTKACISFGQALTDIGTVLSNYHSTLKVRVTEFGWQANTVTFSTTEVVPGTATIFVDNPAGAGVGVQMTVDSGAAQETVTITHLDATKQNITAVFTLPHGQSRNGYQVTILLDCDLNTQTSNYQYVLQTANASPIMEGLDFFTLNYDFGTGSSLVENQGNGTYVNQPAYALMQQFAGGASNTPIPIPFQTQVGGSGGGSGVSQGFPIGSNEQKIISMVPKQGLLAKIEQEIEWFLSQFGL